MKFILSLLLAFSTIVLLNSQSILTKDVQNEIKSLISKGKLDQASQILLKLRTDDWNKLNCEEKAIAYRLQGNLHYYKYEDHLALRYYVDSSYQKVLECDLKLLGNDLLNNIGVIYQFSGKPLLASKYYNKLRLNYLSQKIVPSEDSFKHLSNLASFYEGYGDLYNTFLWASKAKQVGESLDLNLFNVHHLLGIYFEKTNQYSEAIDNYSKALESLPKEKKREYVNTSTNMALAYRFMKNYSKSLEIANLLKKEEKSEKQLYALLNLEALIYFDQGKHSKSEQVFSQIDKMEWVDIENMYHKENKADLKLKIGDIKGAIVIYEKLIKDIDEKWAHIGFVPTSTRDFIKQTELHCLLSKALYLNSKEGQEKRSEVFDNYGFINTNVSKILKSNWESQSSSYLLDEIYPNLYYIIMSYLDEYGETADPKYINNAYQILSQFKNQILERDIQSRIQLKENLPDTVLAQYHKLKSDLNVQYVEGEKSKRSHIETIEKFEKYQLKFDSILINDGSSLALKPKSLEEIQSSLSDQDAFLDLYYSKNKLIRFWITKNEIKANTSHLSTEVIYDFLASIKSGQPINKTTNDSIYMNLFKGINLADTYNVIVHADGLFHKLPIGAIKNPVSNKYLIERLNFRYLLSTDSLYTEDYQWQVDNCLGVASDYNSDRLHQIDSFALNFGKLTGTIEELSNLSEYYDTESLINNEASFDNLFNQISNQNYNIVQLSLHGMLDDRFPAMSGLIFEDENGIDLVDLNRMTGLNNNSDLTIVNSCHSGDGKHVTGEAISNLNTSLFISGSKANIVNLWTSSDIASSEILKDFHEELSNGSNKSKALQLAKQKYLTSVSPSFRHPKYWSSLVLFGNDSPIQENRFNIMYLLSSLLLGLLAILLFMKLKKSRS